jgi:hypothetical protein
MSNDKMVEAWRWQSVVREGEIGATKWRSFGRCVSQGLASNGAQENRYGAP